MSRIVSVLVVLTVVLGGAVPAPANVPDPSRSRVRWSNPATPCGYLFTSAPMADLLTVFITLRDAFDQPIPDCTTSVHPGPVSGTLDYCNCCPGGGGVFAVTDDMGALQFVIGSSIGGRGDLGVDVTAHCAGSIHIASTTVQFTSQDLIASCAPPDVFSLGVWAVGLPPGYETASDYTCDGVVDVFDLGVWAGGLGVSCACP